MIRGLLTELARDPWAMEPKALEAFFQKLAALEGAAAGVVKDDTKVGQYSNIPAHRVVTFGRSEIRLFNIDEISGEQVQTNDPKSYYFNEAPRRDKMTVAGGVARIPVTGLLLKRVPNIVRIIGIEATSYAELRDEISSAVKNEEVREIRLAVDSPGGQVAGSKEAADAIFEANRSKKVHADVDGQAASAAYLLSSQSESITAGPNDVVGSIGVFTVMADWSKMAENEGIKVHVIRSGAHKGAGVIGAPISDEQLEGIQQIIDGMAENFIAAVVRGRGESEKTVREWATGQAWISADALEMGLIDRVSGKAQDTSGGRTGAARAKETGGSMSKEEQAAAEAKAAREKAAEEARAEERKRASDIRAAFPDDPKFAADQIVAGASLKDAQAAYKDVKLKRLEDENAQLKADAKKTDEERAAAEADKGASSRGADPVRTGGGDPATAGSEDFLEKAKAMASEKGITVRAALVSLAKSQPKLYQDYLQKSRERAPEIRKRAREIGMVS